MRGSIGFMKRLCTYVAFVLALTTPVFALDVGGILFQDTTWKLADSPIIVKSNVSVVEGITLTIEAGVTVKFNAGLDLLVDGTIVARGTEAAPITFTSNVGDSPGKWGAISFSDASIDATFDGSGNYTGGCILQHVVVQYGGEGFGAGIKIANAAPFIDHAEVHDNDNDAIRIQGGTPLIANSELGRVRVNDVKEGEVRFDECQFSDNNTAINAHSSILTISGSTFTGNSASNGGAIYADSSTLTISGSTFTGNSASNGGGAIYAYSSSTLTISGSTFTGNSASNDGGAIYAYSSITLTISGSTFTGNSASYGGAIYAYSSITLTISGSTFTSNSASSGGAIYTYSKLILKSSTFSQNIAASQYGGIIHSSSSESVIGGAPGDANTIGDNEGDGVALSGNPTFSYNNLTPNTGLGLVCLNNASSDPIDARNNYWGSAIEGVVKAMIWDQLDDPNRGLVNYRPFLTKPVEADASSPAAVTDLAASDPTHESVKLTWTAPGDDGDQGTASFYDVRYTSQPITNDNWNSATGADGEPSPQAAGSTESMTVTGLSPDTLYYLALKTADDMGQWSALSNVVQIKTAATATLAVWPGDTNDDGVVNQADVLPLGVHWGRTGPARSNASLVWKAQPAQPWTFKAATYADANGDGTINQADVLPIGVNWGLTHDVSSAPMLAAQSPRMKDDPAGAAITLTVQPGPGLYERTVHIQLDGAHDLFGLSLAIHYSSPEQSQPIAVETGDLLGGDLITYQRTDTRAGIVRMAFVRKRPQAGIDGSGTVASLRFQGISRTHFTIQELVAIDSMGNVLPLAEGSRLPARLSAKAARLGPDASDLFQNFPNPFNPETWIPFQLAEATKVTLSIYDAAGNIVRVMLLGEMPAGFYTSRESAAYWDGRNGAGEVVTSGVYFYQIRAGLFQATRRMIIAR